MEDRKDLWIIHFNDVYEVDENKESKIPGGFSRFFNKISELKKKYNPLILFSGDIWSPCRCILLPLYILVNQITQAEHLLFFINQIGVDAACLGNHDLVRN